MIAKVGDSLSLVIVGAKLGCNLEIVKYDQPKENFETLMQQVDLDEKVSEINLTVKHSMQ